MIGAGAAGLMAGIEAGRRGRRVTVIEHNDRAGRKILISGGGRCNFTNLHTSPANFISGNPHFAKSALARYTPRDFIALVERHGIPYHEKTLGQLFCDRSATDITGMLEAECRAAGAEVLLRCQVRSVSKPDRFIVDTSRGTLRAESLVIATGGLSIPKMGATDFGYRIAKQFGHRIVPPRPALVPLLVPGCTELAGVSTEVIASAGRQSFREKMLFTHRGLSGPAILQISSYLPAPLMIDLLPGVDRLESKLSDYLPKRLAQTWNDTPWPQMSRRIINDLAQRLHNWTPDVRGTEGFDKAEVTAGGVDTGQLSSTTMESRLVAGLYFIGEVVDVTGQLGGFNFQWAWASGYCAGQSV